MARGCCYVSWFVTGSRHNNTPKEHIMMEPFRGVAACDAYGVYGLLAGTNGLTVADITAMALAGQTPSRNLVLAVFETEQALQEYLDVHSRPRFVQTKDLP